MNPYPQILVDTGIIVAFYDKNDDYHQQVVNFFATCTSQLITTLACVTEVMWLLAPNINVQHEFLSALAKEAFFCEHLISSDYQRISELNRIYQDLPADFTDLSLIVISERLEISAIATLDKDFDIYRRYRKQFFNRVFYQANLNTNNQPIILKILKENYPTPSELTRYKQEYEITRFFASEGVIKAYDLLPYNNTLAIVLEDFGGKSLDRLMGFQQFKLSDFLAIANKQK